MRPPQHVPAPPCARAWPRLRLAAGLVLASTAAAGGQDGVEPLRKNFLRGIVAESQTLAEQYERALAKLEAELAAGADYETAMQVKKRRDEILAAYRGAGLPVGAVPLTHEAAKLGGAAEARGEELTGWRSASAYAEWTAANVTPGGYYFELEASVSEMPSPGTRAEPRDKVVFTLHEVSPLPGAEVNRRSFEIQSSGRDGVWQALRVGPLRLERRPVVLRLAPQAGYPANRVSFRNVRLIPADPAVIQAPALPETDALVTAREALEKQLADTLAGILKDRQARLKPEEAMEARRLADMTALLQEKGAEKLLTRLARQMGSMHGFVDIEAAALVQPEKASGDRFVIQHGAEVTPVRLMWVEGIPQDDRDGRIRQLARRLGLDAAVMPPLAAAAREFTIAYLQGRSFRVMLHGRPDADGTRPALVFVPGIGLYQNVLVEQGLAFVQPLPQAAGAGLEEGMHASLMQSQRRAQRLKNGAWAVPGEEKK